MPIDTETLMRDSRARLILGHPFFGFPSMNLTMRPDDSVPTMQTDGVSLVYNPAFADSLTETDRQGVIAHETAHCMLSHVFRRSGRDPELWNQAADFVTNGLLRANGFSLPADCLYDSQYDGLSAELVYDKLQAMSKDQRPQQKPDDVKDCPGKPAPAGQESADSGAGQSEGQSQSAETIEAQWRTSVIQADTLSKAYGKQEGGAKAFIDSAQRPRIDWRSVLREFVATLVPADFSMFPPARRHLWRGLILPAVKKTPSLTLLVAIDTSGSISDKTLADFVSELDGILDAGQMTIHVVCCDRAVHPIGEFTHSPIGQIQACGRGGTSFAPPFRWAESEGLALDGAVYFTDGYGDWPTEPSYPTLWVMSTDVRPPFGQTVRL